ncbi:hypothetical protein [Acinetobacter wuhouensis]|uniref:Uncharacterized protein n=1 Tax=Acinetobacter wuhouensis TaxID=1879050 RepID=A0A3G2T6Z3_9GAMM|nr:hypothetical protein [Acinetobacter wuhouensis]AYO55762.1 hypothetical protein CDG68_19870 [Acinetobacter wuhouensis]
MKYIFFLPLIFFINACSYQQNDHIQVKKIIIDDNENVEISFFSSINYREKNGSEVGSYIFCEPSNISNEKNNLSPDFEKKAITGVIDDVKLIENHLYSYNVLLEKTIKYNLLEEGSDYTCQRFTGSMSNLLKKSEKFKINLEQIKGK